MTEMCPWFGLSPVALRRRRETWFVLGLAFAIRLAVLLLRSSELNADPDAYRQLAETLADQGTYGRPSPSNAGSAPCAPTAYRPPLYPLLLAATARNGRVSAAAVATLHLAAGMSTVWLVLRLARRLELGRAAPLAALLVAGDPILLNQSTLVMTETLATFLAAAVLLSAHHLVRAASYRAAACTGLCLGLAALCRPTFLPLAPCLAIVCCLRSSAAWPRRAAVALALLLVTSAVLSPWILRNRLVFGRWIATTTHGGYTLLLGNNPHFYRHLRSDAWGQIWTLPSDDYVMRQCREAQPDVAARLALLAPTEREIAEDALAYACACRHIADDPGAFVLACAYRAGQFITPLPHATFAPESLVRCVLRYAIGLWYLMLYASLLASVMRRGRDLVRPEWLPLAVLVLGLAAAHLTYWSNLRMRGPIMPALCVLALAGWSRPARTIHKT